MRPPEETASLNAHLEHAKGAPSTIRPPQPSTSRAPSPPSNAFNDSLNVSLNADRARRNLNNTIPTPGPQRQQSTLLMSESEIRANNAVPATEEPERHRGFLDLESFRQQKRWICYAQLRDGTLTGKN